MPKLTKSKKTTKVKKKTRNVKNVCLFIALCSELGGITRVSEICNCAPPSIYGWKKNGIPNARLMYLRLAYPNLKAWDYLKG